MFEGRLPARFQALAPAVEETSRGHQIWRFDGRTYSQVGMNAVAGRRPETVEIEPFRFDEMRKGCWDVDARVHDMDLGGIWASVNFPSRITYLLLLDGAVDFTTKLNVPSLVAG